MAARAAYAVPCDGSTTCEAPSSNATTEAAGTASASGFTGLRSLVSVGPTGNQVGSRYYFAAVSTDFGASVANGGITEDGNGFRVIANAFTSNASQSPSATVTGGFITELLGGQSYFIYAQACPAGTASNGTRCSSWSKVRPATFSTLAYPTAVFDAPVPGNDSTNNSIWSRTNVPAADQGVVSVVDLVVEDLDNALSDTALLGYVPGTANYQIDNSLYSPGFRPNTRYRTLGFVRYPYGVNVPIGGREIEGTFVTIPNAPGNFGTDGVLSFTHVTATVRFHNSASGVTFGNPAGTQYEIRFVPTSGTTITNSVAWTSVTGSPSEQSPAILTAGLADGMFYTAQVRALNRGRGAGWSDSPWTTLGTFTTIPWGLTLTVPSPTVFFTSATAQIAVTDASGLSHFYVNGSAQQPWPGGLNASYQLTGLTPNTSYSIQARLCEQPASVEYCSTNLPVTPVTFATDPYAPTAGSYSGIQARQVTANWTDASANPNGSNYEIQRCDDAGFSAGCASVTQGKVSGASQSRALTGLTPETNYYVRVRTQNVGRPTWPDSSWFSLGLVTTINEAPTVSNPVCTPSGTTASCTVSATDNGGGADLQYVWSVSPSAGVTINPNSQINNNATTITFPGNGNYTVSVVVTDKNGSGLSTGPRSTTVNIGAIPTSISISPVTANIVTGNNQLFTATVLDQFGVAIPNAPVNWALAPLGNPAPNPQNNSPTTTVTATTPGNFTLTASWPGATSGTASISIVAAGAFFVNAPVVTVKPDNLTGDATALGGDNVSGEASLKYTWSVDSGPGPISVANNGTNSAKNAVIVFSKAGDYVIRCTLSNQNGSVSATAPAVRVNSVLRTITVNPPEATVKVLADQVFTAATRDQFGDPINGAAITWTTTGGSINGGGVFNASAGTAIGQRYTVSARSGGVTGNAFVNVINYDVSNAYAYPVPFKSNRDAAVTFTNLGSSAKIKIFTTTGQEVWSLSTTNNNETWNVRNTSGDKVASGVYFYRIESPEGKKDGKLIIIQ